MSADHATPLLEIRSSHRGEVRVNADVGSDEPSPAILGGWTEGNMGVGSHDEGAIAQVRVRSRNGTTWFLASTVPALLVPVWLGLWHAYPHPLTTTSGLLVLLLLGASAATDIRRHKIHNWATYTALLWGLILNFVASVWSSFAPGKELSETLLGDTVGPAWLGGVGLGQSLLGGAACFAIVLFAYRLARGGAGDVKLATAVGALLGLRLGVLAVAVSYIVAASVIVLGSMWRKGGLRVLAAFFRQIGAFFLPALIMAPSESDRDLLDTPMPLAPSFAVGTVLVMLEVVS